MIDSGAQDARTSVRDAILNRACLRYVERYGRPTAATSSVDDACWRLLNNFERILWLACGETDIDPRELEDPDRFEDACWALVAKGVLEPTGIGPDGWTEFRVTG